VGSVAIFNNDEHTDAHFPKKGSKIKFRNANGKERKNKVNFGICIHRQHMILGSLDRSDYEAVVKEIEKARAEAKARQEAEERAATNPEELLSQKSNEIEAVDEVETEDSLRENPVSATSDDDDIDDDDAALREIDQLERNGASCELTYKTAYNQDFAVAHIKSLGKPDDWTIHAQEDVDENALWLRWSATIFLEENEKAWMAKNNCDPEKSRKLIKEANIPLTQYTTSWARRLLETKQPSLIAREHHTESYMNLEKMSEKQRIQAVHEETKNHDWELPSAEVLGSSTSDRQIQEAMQKKESSEVPLRMLGYNF